MLKRKSENRLTQLRKEKGISQIYIAEKVVFRNIKTYRKYETSTDYSEIPLCDLIKLADYYNVTIDYLCGRSDCTRTDSHYIEKVLGLSQAAQDTLQALYENGQKDNTLPASLTDIINFILSHNDSMRFDFLMNALRCFILKNKLTTLCTMESNVHDQYEPLPYNILLASDDTRSFGISLNLKNIVETSSIENMHKLLYEWQAIYEKEQKER